VKRAILVTFTAVALGFAPAALGGSDFNTQSRYPYTLTMTNECNGELVQFTGEQHLQWHRHDNKDGSTTITAEINWSDVKGLGLTTGDIYAFASNAHTTTTFPAGTTEFYVYAQRQTIRLVSRGSGPNMFISFLWDYTYDALGFRTSLFDLHVRCPGQ
jgi:hypothetical protein